jgi:hypothetical protein
LLLSALSHVEVIHDIVQFNGLSKIQYIYLHVKIIKVNKVEVCAPLGYCAAKIGFCLDLSTLEDGTDRLIRNVGEYSPTIL